MQVGYLIKGIYGRFVSMQVRTRTFRPGMFRPITSSSHCKFDPWMFRPIYKNIFDIFVTFMALYIM